MSLHQHLAKLECVHNDLDIFVSLVVEIFEIECGKVFCPKGKQQELPPLRQDRQFSEPSLGATQQPSHTYALSFALRLR